MGVKKKKEYSPRYFVRLCSDKAAFEVKFSQKLRLDMPSVKKAFEDSKRYEIILYTPQIMVLKSGKEVEITFSKDERMLIKNVSSKDQAEAIAESVLRVAFKTCSIRRKMTDP